MIFCKNVCLTCVWQYLELWLWNELKFIVVAVRCEKLYMQIKPHCSTHEMNEEHIVGLIPKQRLKQDILLILISFQYFLYFKICSCAHYWYLHELLLECLQSTFKCSI